tara:strand:- start:2517 stop:3503 length:987 start_codon:yes stop_codon:yes gene_type:complete
MITLEDIEKLLDKKLDEKLDEKFNEKFKEIDKKFDKIDDTIKDFKKELSNLKNSVNNFNDKFEKYIQKESDGIEYEINKNVKYFLKNKYQGSIIIKSLELNTLKNYLENKNEILTEFDGIFTIEYKKYYKQKGNILKDLIIVESKHHVTIEKINEKIYQLYFIKKILEISKNKDDIKNSKLLNLINKKKLDKINNKFYFYIGGPTWNIDEKSNAIEYLQKINNGKLENIKWIHKSLKKEQEIEILQHLKNHIGIIIPNGTRYNLYENITHTDELLTDQDLLYKDHSEYKSLSARDLETIKEDRKFGGYKNIQCLEMKYQPNYMNIKYI